MPEPIAAPVVAPKPKEVFIDDMENRFKMYRVLSNGDEVEIIQSKKEEKKPVSVEEAFNMKIRRSKRRQTEAKVSVIKC